VGRKKNVPCVGFSSGATWRGSSSQGQVNVSNSTCVSFSGSKTKQNIAIQTSINAIQVFFR
jgi:hypothetical protein